MTQAYEISEHDYDVVIVGAGGAGLRVALGMAASGLSPRLGRVSATMNFQREDPRKSLINAAISSAAVSNAKWPASRTWTWAFGTSRR